MKKLYLLMGMLMATLSSIHSQSPTIGNIQALMVPQYAASGNSTRLPVIYRARIFGLPPNTPFKYVTRAISASDFSSTVSVPGAGNCLLIDTGKGFKYITSVSLTSNGQHDTFVTDNTGSYEGWFGFVNTGNARFNAGNYVYPIIVFSDTANNLVQKWYINDSIQCLAFDTTAGSGKGTGIYGKSVAPDKNIVALYDNSLGNGRPLSMTYVESESISIASVPGYYSANVNGKSGYWGTTIPNTLSSGVRRIEQFDFKTGNNIYANTDSNGIWGASSKSTVDPRGGTLNPIALDEDDAALVAPLIEFWTRSSQTKEDVGNYEIYVSRKYSNEHSSSVRIQVVGGTATNGSGNDYQLTVPKTITFKPGKASYDTSKITINDDNFAEGNETIVTRLDQPNNCKIGVEVAHTITIEDNDIANISFESNLLKIKEDAGTAEIKIKIDRAVNNPSTLKLYVKKQGDSTLIPGEFKLGSNGKDSTFNLGNSTSLDSISIDVIITDDLNKDPNDSIWLVLRQTAGNALIADSNLLMVVVDNDGPSTVRFLNANTTVTEKSGSVDFKVIIPSRTDAAADFILRFSSNISSAEEGKDFSFNPTSKIYSVDNSLPDTIDVSVPIIDDEDFETTEKIYFTLANLNNTKILNPDTLEITLISDDAPIYSIGTVNKQSNANKTADSLNVDCRLIGVVHGVNMRTNGLSFTLIDQTGGIGVFSPSSSFGYIVTEGDSIMIQGSIGQFQGTVQIQFIDTIVFLGSNGKVRNPVLVTDLNETTESKVVQIRRVKLVDPSEWPSTALNANGFKNVRVEQTNGLVDTLNIDAETNVDGNPAPQGYFNVTGIGGQFDNSSPYTSRYVLSPRYFADISPASLPTIRFTKTKDTIYEPADSFTITMQVLGADENFTVSLVVAGGNAESPKDYNFTNTTINILKNENFYTRKANISNDVDSDGQKTLNFALRNVNGPGNIGADSLLNLVILDDEPASVSYLNTSPLKLYPNPSNEIVYIENENILQSYQVIGADGKVYIYGQVNSKSFPIDLAQLSAGTYMILAKDIFGNLYLGKAYKN